MVSAVKRNMLRIIEFRRMKSCVITTKLKKHQIFNSIIILNAVNMVSDFFRINISPKILFYNQMASKNVSTFLSHWVKWIKYTDIPMPSINFATTPVGAISSNCKFIMAGFRAKMGFVSFKSTWSHERYFLAKIAWNFGGCNVFSASIPWGIAFSEGRLWNYASFLSFVPRATAFNKSPVAISRFAIHKFLQIKKALFSIVNKKRIYFLNTYSEPNVYIKESHLIHNNIMHQIIAKSKRKIKKDTKGKQMKKNLLLLLCVLLVGNMFFAEQSSAVSWTRNYSSASDGSPLSGSDLQDIQTDIDGQTPTLAGNNEWSGNQEFTGTVSGVGAARDIIARGFELKYGSAEQLIIKAGLLYHNDTEVSITTNTHIDVTTAGDYVTGVSERAIDIFLYVYSTSAGALKFSTTAPNRADTNGNTEGTLYYLFVSPTFYRVVGAVKLNDSNSGEIIEFFQSGNEVSWQEPHTVVSAASSTWANVDLSAVMPEISVYGRFGVLASDNNANVAAVMIRPGGSTFSDGFTAHAEDAKGVMSQPGGATDNLIAGELESQTDDSQTIDYINSASLNTSTIVVKGYKLNIR